MGTDCYHWSKLVGDCYSNNSHWLLVQPTGAAQNPFQAIAAAAGGLARLAEGGPSQAVRGRGGCGVWSSFEPKTWEFAWIYTYGNFEDESCDWNMWKMWEHEVLIHWSQVPSVPNFDPYWPHRGVIDAPVAALDAARVSGPFGAVAGGQEGDRFALSFQL